MKKSGFAFLTIFFLALVSCTSNKSLHILTDDAKEVQTNASVFYKGMEIGKINAIHPLNNQILITLSLNKDIVISKNAEIFLNSDGKHGILVSELAKVGYKNNDTILFQNTANLFPEGFADDVKNVIMEVDKLGTLLDKVMRKLE